MCLQYADDTLLLFEPDTHSIASVKAIPLCFELMSGLKINFAKSEFIVTGVSKPEALWVSRFLNYSLGSFPLKYLGHLISHEKLFARDFAPAVAKVGNRVMPWRGKYNTQPGNMKRAHNARNFLKPNLIGPRSTGLGVSPLVGITTY